MGISKIKMADYIPFEIQTEIIKSLPIKSLIRFRSVSKPWKSLIDSSEFNVDYHVRLTQPQQHLLVTYTHSHYYTEEYFSLADDDTFPRDKFHLNAPMSVKRLPQPPHIFGNSQGLICFYNLDRRPHESGKAILWNPSIRKSIVIDVPVLDIPYETVVGFGVCHNTRDPKLVKISFACDWTFSLPWQVEVFTLSSRTWRNISINLPRNSIALCHKDPVVIDGVLYWLAFDRTFEVRFRSYKLVISFDLTSGEFRKINFPNHLQQHSENLLIYKPTKSLAVVAFSREDDKSVCTVWIMKLGVRESFTKLFKVLSTDNLIYRGVREFRKNGEAIMELMNKLKNSYQVSTKLETYEPFSEHIHDLGIHRASAGLFSVTSYTESILLLDQPDSIFD